MGREQKNTLSSNSRTAHILKCMKISKSNQSNEVLNNIFLFIEYSKMMKSLEKHIGQEVLEVFTTSYSWIDSDEDSALLRNQHT